LVYTLLGLLCAIAALYLLEKLWHLLVWLSDLFLLFALAWLITFILNPLVDWLSSRPVPVKSWPFIRKWVKSPFLSKVDTFRLPHGLAVVLVYLGLLVAVVLGGAYFIPTTAEQFIQLGAKLPDYIRQAPDLLLSLQETLARFNVQVDLMSLYRSEELLRRAQELGSQIVQLALPIAAGVASAVTKAFIVLTLSFYMMLEEKRLSALMWRLIPSQFREEADYALKRFQQIFGAYVRGVLLVAILYGVGVMMVMQLAGLSFVVVIGLVSGVLTLIPYIGDPIAMMLPALITIFQRPEKAVWVFVAVAAYQQVLVRIILPKILSEATDMPALLVIASIMIGVRLIGMWGFIFAIPVAGVIYAMGLYFLEKYQGSSEQRDKG